MSGVDRAAIVPLPADADPAAWCAPIAGEPAVVRSVRALLDHVRASRIAVVAAEASDAMVRDALGSYGCADVRVLAAPAAGDRSDAIVAGVEALVAGPNSLAFILVHDVRYPLVPAAVSARVLAGLQSGHRVVVPVMPITDSVKSVDERGVVTATVDRTALLAAQYPRGFATTTLHELRSDDLAVALAAGVRVTTVDGHPDGLRFDVPQDAGLLEAIIASRH